MERKGQEGVKGRVELEKGGSMDEGENEGWWVEGVLGCYVTSPA